MKKRILSSLVLLLIFLVLGCGRKGPILPPLVKSPYPAKNISIKQVGEEILLEWTNPSSYMDGDPLPMSTRIEIWHYIMDKETYDEEGGPGKKDFSKKASLLGSVDLYDIPSTPQGTVPSGRYSYTWMRKGTSRNVFIIGLRVNDSRRKMSDYTLKTFAPMILSLPPEDLEVILSKETIKLEWKAPQKNIDASSPPRFAGYHIYRSQAGQDKKRITAVVLKESEFIDKEFQFGKDYTYQIRTVLSAEIDQYESGDSEPVIARPRDVYPPDPPTGLVVIAGSRLVALSWTANSEDDLSEYKIWRKTGEEDYILLTQLKKKENSYSDMDVEQGSRYTYSLSAVDSEGNESRKSRQVLVVIRSNTQ